MWTLPSLVYFFVGWCFAVAGETLRETDERLGALTIPCLPLFVLAAIRILYDLNDPWTRIFLAMPRSMNTFGDPRSLLARSFNALVLTGFGIGLAGWGVSALL